MAQYCYDSGSTNKLFCKCFLLSQGTDDVILNVLLSLMTQECAIFVCIHNPLVELKNAYIVVNPA